MSDWNNTSNEEKAKAHETANKFADNLSFDAEQRAALTGFLDSQLKAMENEDPESIIYCSCCGNEWPAKDVDAWGLCPAGRGYKAVRIEKHA